MERRASPGGPQPRLRGGSHTCGHGGPQSGVGGREPRLDVGGVEGLRQGG